MSDIKIKEILKRYTDKLMAVPGVVSVAEGKSHGKQCIRIFVIDSKPEILKLLPDTLEGYPVDVVESGEFRALDT
jgi:hypothetical protein